MPQSINHEEDKENILLVYVNQDASDDHYSEMEMEGLVEAAGGQTVGHARQRLDRPYKGHYIGTGKVEEIKLFAAELDADVVAFDCELSGMQLRNLETKIERHVIDRTQLILDIFARRARTREGMLQVELAQLTYRLPRLMSVYTKFERQRGGIGMRGPGETKLESDRRTVRDKIARLKHEIDGVKLHRDLQREGRRDQPYPFVAIIGYTSAGKSTLMNKLCNTDLLADAMPFATLDPTIRKLDLPDGFSFFLSDTVGFIRKLPTMLVASFRATLEELLHADLLLHVVDVSLEDWEIQFDAVIDTITQLKAGDIPIVTVFNKIDAVPDKAILRQLVADWPDSVAISAKTGEGLDDLFEKIRKMLSGRLGYIRALVPYEHAKWVESAYDYGRVILKEYQEGGILLEADLAPELRGKLEKFRVP